MKKLLFPALLALLTLLSCNRDNDTRLVIITFDGLRWQELFGGADEALVSDTRFVKDPAALNSKFWRDTPEERRETLFPFLWSYVPENGYFIGNRTKNSRMRVANTMNFSYPGYSEMFCGWADDERIDSNDPVPNPNKSVLEAVNEDPRYKGSVMMYSSWESIRYAVNNERGGFPASSAHEPSYTNTLAAKAIQEIDRIEWTGFGESERADVITYAMAMETLKEEHPKVFYVGFGDTDEFTHGGQYDKYLECCLWTDGFIKDIVEFCEGDPFYKGKTTYILTCDHGRGRGAAFRSHGESIRGSDETWFIAFGKGIPVLGETSDNGVFYTKQFAATIADILGIDFTPSNGEKCEPIDPSYQKEDDLAKPVASLSAVQAKPKGHGLRYEYREADFLKTVEFLSQPVKKAGITPVFGTDAVKRREDHFGIVFRGLFKVETSGDYIFSVVTDDGSKTWVDGVLLADMDRDGGGYCDIPVTLEAGYHRIDMHYFENYGGDEISVGLEGPGISVENMPASMLYYD